MNRTCCIDNVPNKNARWRTVYLAMREFREITLLWANGRFKAAATSTSVASLAFRQRNWVWLCSFGFVSMQLWEWRMFCIANGCMRIANANREFIVCTYLLIILLHVNGGRCECATNLLQFVPYAIRWGWYRSHTADFWNEDRWEDLYQ